MATTPRKTKTHRNNIPCTGRGCPTCWQQRKNRRIARRKRGGGGGRPGGAMTVFARTVPASAPMASQAWYDDQARRRAEADAAEAQATAEYDAREDARYRSRARLVEVRNWCDLATMRAGDDVVAL